MKLTVKTYFKTLLGLILVINLSACDPARVLIIENETETKIEIEIELKECENRFIQSLNDNNEFKNVTLGTTQREVIKAYYFGLGGWSKEELGALIECTMSISIKEPGKSIRIIEGKELRNMLPKKRIGIFNNVMEIKILKAK